jgi:hypothetical protein
MAVGVRTIRTRFDGDTRGIDAASKRAGGSVGRFSKALSGLKTAALAGAAAVAAVGVAAVAFGPKLLDQAAGWELAANKAKIVFEDQLGVAEKWAKDNGAAMGLTTREAVGLAASFADLLKPMGFGAKEATKMATNVVGLSGALSEWTSGKLSSAEVSDILAKAMLGEREGLKQLGISIMESDVQARLAKKGQQGLTGAALEQAKAIATQELIFEKSADAQKAYAEGGDTLSRTLATGKAKLRDWAQTLIVKATPAIKKAAEWVELHLAPAVRRFAGWVRDEVVPALQTFAGWVRDEVLPRLEDLWGYLEENVIPVLKTLVEGAIKVAKKAWDDITEAVRDHKDELIFVGKGLKDVADFIVKYVLPVLGPLFVGAVGTTVLVIRGLIFTTAMLVRGWQFLATATKVVASGIGDAWTGVRNLVVGTFNGLIRFFGGLGAKFRSAASGMWDGIRDAFRSAINWVIDKWNSLSFTLPPVKFLGQTFGGFTLSTPHVNRFHTGGVVPGPLGREVPILARAGERVLTREQQQTELGDTHVTVVIDGRAVDESLVRVVSRRDRRLGGRLATGVGLA